MKSISRLAGLEEPAMTDREKKIAEIREALEKIDRGDLFEIAMTHEKSGEWLRFLLDELERLEREYEKLINGLLTIVHYASEDGVHWKLDKCYTTVRDILKEIGVTVE